MQPISILRRNPAWRLAFGAMMLSFAPILVRTTTSPPTTSAFYRMLLGGLMLLIMMLVRRQSFAVPRVLALVLIGGGAAFAFDLFFWHRSIHLVGPGLATLLSGFQVFILAIIGILFLGERMRWEIAVAIPAAFVGVAMIIGLDWSALSAEARQGILFGLATAACYSAYLLIMRKARHLGGDSVLPMADVAWMSLACAASLAVLATTTGESLALTSGAETLRLGAYALLAQLGLVVISSSLNKVPTSLVGLLLLLEPTFAYVWDILLFDRPLRLLEIAGAALAIGAIYLGSRNASTTGG